MTHDLSATDEARAQRAARQTMQRSQADDPLVKRERVIGRWKVWAETDPAFLPYKGAWWWPFKVQKWGRRLLMPGVRATLNARDAEREHVSRAELREHCRKWQEKKAARLAEKQRAKAPQGQLFSEGAR